MNNTVMNKSSNAEDTDNKEIEAITKIMGYFGVDCSDIHSKIHRIFTGEDDVPILVAKEEVKSEIKQEVKKEIMEDIKEEVNEIVENQGDKVVK
jgi:hypothetical protein